MNKYAMSVAVMALLGSSASVNGHRHHHHHHHHPNSYVQFIDGDNEFDEIAIAQANALTNSAVNIGEAAYDKQVTKGINAFIKKRDQAVAEEQAREGIQAVPVPTQKPLPTQQMAQSYSDPIYGSLGRPGVDYNDLTPEQKFEQDQRDRTPPVYTDDEDVTANNNSIKVAEGIVGAKMAEPTDPKQVLKMKKTPVYEMFDSDDEEDDTVETRRSIKTAEKQLGHRFFINAKDQGKFAKAVTEGKVD